MNGKALNGNYIGLEIPCGAINIFSVLSKLNVYISFQGSTVDTQEADVAGQILEMRNAQFSDVDFGTGACLPIMTR